MLLGAKKAYSAFYDKKHRKANAWNLFWKKCLHEKFKTTCGVIFSKQLTGTCSVKVKTKNTQMCVIVAS